MSDPKFLSEKRPRTVVLIGGGVTGAMWIAPFIGVQVRLYDPSRSAVERLQEMSAKALGISAADAGSLAGKAR